MTDLASSIVGGANSPGNFVLLTPQRVMYDGRRSWLAIGDQPGESLDWPLVAPFKDGWIALQTLVPYVGSPATAQPRQAKLIRYDEDGVIVWETALSTTLASTVSGSTDRFMAGNDTHILVRKSGNNFHLLDVSADDGTYSLGGVAFTLSTTNFEQIDSHNGGYIAHKTPGGWVIFGIDLNGASSTVSIAGLDEDFNLLGTDTESGWNTTDAERPWFTSHWNGTGPAIVQPYLSTGGGTRIWSVTFDGTASPVISAPTTTTLDQNTGPSHYRGTVGNGMHDTEFNTDSPLNWVPSDGTDSIVDPNPYYWELSDYENLTSREGSHSLIAPSIRDYDNTTDPSSPYYGDRDGSWPVVVRHNWVNWDTKAAGHVDLATALPADATPGVSYAWGMGFDDVDEDESCFTIVNPTNWRVLCWQITYWTQNPHTIGCGLPCGDNALTSYWIAQLGPGESAPPETPGWVNFFDTSGVPDPDCPMLGSGDNVVFLYDRGGARQIAKIDGTSLVRWRRRRDDISNATVFVTSPSKECCEILKDIAVGRHEIVIFRDGERSWEGPITRLAYTDGQVEIEAADIGHYISRTIMRNPYDNRYSKKKSKVGPVTRRAQIILSTELQRKEVLRPSYNILRFLDVRTHPKTTRTSRFTHAYQSTVWEELDYMAAKLSLDYTAVGRRLLINDVHDVIGRTEMLTDKDFNNPLVITVYGMELATRSAVTDGEGHWAAVGGIDDFYGEVELLHTMYGEEARPSTGTKPTAEELRALTSEMSSQAQRNMAGRYPVPTVVRIPDNTQLHPTAPITMDQLVPGMRIPIRATQTCIELEQEQKLDLLTVEQTSTGETVSITLSPAPGTTPWDDSSETSEDDEEVV